MKIVTAMAPRCGTSFVLRACVDAGLPVNGVPFINENLTPVAGNPLGYYEMVEPPRTGMIQKVWPVDLVKIDPRDISALVVLDRRDKHALFDSMMQQAKREGMDHSVEDAYMEISSTLRDYLTKTNIDYKLVYTEDLTGEISNILDYLGR